MFNGPPSQSATCLDKIGLLKVISLEMNLKNPGTFIQIKERLK